MRFHGSVFRVQGSGFSVYGWVTESEALGGGRNHRWGQRGPEYAHLHGSECVFEREGGSV